MAKNATRANESSGKATKATGAVDVAGSQLPENIAAKVGEAIQKFGEATVNKAVHFATEALVAISGADAEVSKARQELEGLVKAKSEGNTSFLFALAKECVTLTTKGKRANLKDAAELMRAACNFAEDTFLANWAEKHNGVRPANVREVASSWPTLKSDAINSLDRAGLNPHKFANGSAIFNTAYKAFKEGNAGEKSSRGRKEGSGTKATVKVELKKDVAGTVKIVNELDAKVQEALTKLIRMVNSQPKSVQAACIPKIDALTAEIKEMKLPQVGAEKDEAKDKEAGVSTRRRNPARETEHAPPASA